MEKKFNVGEMVSSNARVIQRGERAGHVEIVLAENEYTALRNALKALEYCASPFEQKHLQKRELVGEASKRMSVARLGLAGQQ